MKKVSNLSHFDTPSIVLVRPQLAENMGMTARSMMNTSLTDLRLVHPREDHLSDRAKSASSGASTVLEDAHTFQTLSDAIVDCHFVLATTARPRDMVKPVYAPHEACLLLKEKIKSGQKTAVLFGAERTGLENDELILADGIIEIPLNPNHSSLNLSQAVLIFGYEYFQTHLDMTIPHVSQTPASKEEVDTFLSHLDDTLTQHGYFRFPDKNERMRRNLRNIFTRNNLTHSEIKTLYGVITDLTRIPTK